MEVFPPLIARRGRSGFDLQGRIDEFVAGVKSIRDVADLFLVASIKDPSLIQLSPIHAASLLQEQAKVKAAPVVVVRDSNRTQFTSQVATAIALGLSNIMVAWGDRYPPELGITNFRDYVSLSEAIQEARVISRGAPVKTRILAPVDLSRMKRVEGIELARSRLRAGAELLLAQPPTTDSEETFDGHLEAISEVGLRRRVLLSVFPFRGAKDVVECEKKFGWNLRRKLHTTAARGEKALLEESRSVAARTRKERLSGVYVSTRGRPEVARLILSRAP